VYNYYSFHVIFFIQIAQADTKYSLSSQNDVQLSVQYKVILLFQTINLEKLPALSSIQINTV